MKVGVISDTHDNLDILNKVVDIFNDEKKVDFVVHCGDFCSPFAVKILNRLACDFVGVFGNNDGEILGLNKMSQGKIFKPPFFKTIGDKSFVIMHEGDIADYIDEKIDFVLFGHTHLHLVKPKGKQMIVNPGTLSGYVTGVKSYALIDTDTKKSIIEFL